MEHRHGCRVELNVSATLVSLRAESVHADLVNLSSGGALLRIGGSPRELSRVVDLVFRMPSGDDSLVKWRALVIRREANTIALMFDKRRDAAVSRLFGGNADVYPGKTARRAESHQSKERHAAGAP